MGPISLLEITFHSAPVAILMDRILTLVPTIALALVASLAAQASTRIVTPAPGGPLVGTVRVELAPPEDVSRIDLWLDDRMVGTLRQAPWVMELDAGFSSGERSLRVVTWRAGMSEREVLEHRASAMRVDATVAIDLVEVPLRVRGGRRVDASMLHISENGRPQRIVELRDERPDSRFVFVVDRSLSMRDGRLERVLDAIRKFGTKLRAGDSLEVILFNHTVSASAGFDDASRDAIASGGTALYDALASISPSGRSIVIVVSDADDRHSVAGAEDARRHMSRRGVVLYSNTLERGNAASLLDDLARTTGGLAVHSSDPHHALQRILEDVNSRLIAVYQSDGVAPGWRTIEVRPAATGFRIRSARKGYLAR